MKLSMQFIGVRLVIALAAMLILEHSVSAAPQSATPQPAAPPAPAGPAAVEPLKIEPSKIDPQTIPILKQLMAQGAKVTSLGHLHGFDGWLVYKPSLIQIIYTTPNSDGVIVGVLYGPSGENETSKQIGAVDYNSDPDLRALRKAAEDQMKKNPTAQTASNTPAPNAGSPGDRLMDDAEHVASISFGASDLPILYVVADPLCPYCKALWQNLATRILPQGKIQIQLIPVGIVEMESPNLVSKILSAQDSAVAWAQFEAGNLTADGLAPSSDNGKTATEANLDFVRKWKIASVPFSFYRNKAGKVMVIGGENLDNVVTDMTGEQ